MKVCLVNPTPIKISDLPLSDRPHIGLGYLAGYLKENMPQLNLKVIDGKIEKLTRDQLLGKIDEFGPDFLGVTSFTQEIYDATFLCKKMKESKKDLITCIGGVHVWGVNEQILEEFNEIDYAILGEGESVLYELLTALQKNKSIEQIKGIIFRNSKGEVISTGPADLVMNLDLLPLPDWSHAKNAAAFPLLTSRGCPFQCVFCMRPYGNRVRSRSPENVMKEIEILDNQYHAKLVVFCDETLGAIKGNFMEILDEIIKRGINNRIAFDGHTNVNMVDYQFFDKMKKAGFINVGFGVESGDDQILKNIGKSISKEKVRNAVKLAKQVGLHTHAYFILGLPNETYKSAFNTISFAKELNTDVISIGLIIPFPRTKINEMVTNGENGYIKPTKPFNWNDFNKQISNPLRFKNINYNILRSFQIMGYLYHLLGNFRFNNLYSRFLKHRRRALLICKNFLRDITPFDKS
jgi:anaerobic magnesium-protoporphyrin IX monomethyl ester cyclase